MAAARAWYDGPAYQEAAAHRQAGAEGRMFLVEGLEDVSGGRQTFTPPGVTPRDKPDDAWAKPSKILWPLRRLYVSNNQYKYRQRPIVY